MNRDLEGGVSGFSERTPGKKNQQVQRPWGRSMVEKKQIHVPRIWSQTGLLLNQTEDEKLFSK